MVTVELKTQVPAATADRPFLVEEHWELVVHPQPLPEITAPTMAVVVQVLLRATSRRMLLAGMEVPVSFT
jgi:hypothetical protein